MKIKDYPDVCTVKEVAEILNIGMNTAYYLVRNNIIKSRKIGRIYRIPKIFVYEYLQRNNKYEN